MFKFTESIATRYERNGLRWPESSPVFLSGNVASRAPLPECLTALATSFLSSGIPEDARPDILTGWKVDPNHVLAFGVDPVSQAALTGHSVRFGVSCLVEDLLFHVSIVAEYREDVNCTHVYNSQSLVLA